MTTRDQSTSAAIFFRLLLILIVISSVASCYNHTYTPTRTRDFSIATTKDRTRALPQYVLFNLNDSVSRLYYSVKASDLLYSRSNVTNQLTAHVKIEYVLHPVDAPKSISDSGFIVLNDVNDDGSFKLLQGYTDFDVPENADYFMDITLRDLNKMTTTYDMLYLYHNGPDAQNNFLLTKKESETPLFRNYVGKDEEFSIRYKDATITKLFVTYHQNTADAARPPYALPIATLPVAADSAWVIDIAADPVHVLNREGYYRFTTTAGATTGFFICRFPEDFPRVTTPPALLEPLRYITTKKEYTTIQTSAKLKWAIDSFWIATGGSQERARELISAYYGRVEIVNTHFSTYKEGWKTDRGMVYIIYGEPQNVYRTANAETWVYGQDQSGNTLNFVFNRNTTSGFSNDFELERNQAYNVSWITAVDYWKQGQVYRAR